jgi:hypothetical protein
MNKHQQIIVIVICGFHLLMNSLYGQKFEPARICIYRSDKFICNSFNFDVEINKQIVHTLKPALKKNVGLEYLVVSEGVLNISIKNWVNEWTSSTVLNVRHGKTYFIRIDCSISGITLNTDEEIGKAEWTMASKGFVSTIAEDPNRPLIEKPDLTKKDENNTIVKTIIRVDTVKQTVYIKESNKFNFEPFADIDFNIPSTGKQNELTFALIIGNEDYKSFQTDLAAEANVKFARNDASVMKEYAIKSLGIPEKNIQLLLDGTYGQINQAISKINLIAKTMGVKATILFYYAGHGMPEDATKEPYLIPVDISGSNVTSGIKLKDVYSRLTEFPTERVYVFLDACFTGGARDESLIAGRSISIKPKEQTLKGNIVVFSASSGNQASLSYLDKRHGMFTYFLLKKIQETNAEVSLKELSGFLKEKVALESLLINHKEQNPQTNTSANIAESWGKWKLYTSK